MKAYVVLSIEWDDAFLGPVYVYFDEKQARRRADSINKKAQYSAAIREVNVKIPEINYLMKQWGRLRRSAIVLPVPRGRRKHK